MRTSPIAPSSTILRWILTLSIIAAAIVMVFPLHFEQQYPLESFILPLAFAGALVTALIVYFATFPQGMAIIHHGVRCATEGTLKPIEAPRRIRFFFGPIIEDYNILIRNMGSLFREMEQSQLSIIGDRNRNDAILRSLPGALLTVDSDFRVTLSNKQAEQLFDLCTDGLLGKNLFELLPLNEDGRELLREAFLYEQQVNNKEIVLTDGNTARHYTLNITFFRQSQNAIEYCAAVMLQDITDYKRLQELIHQSEKFLAIGKLAGGVAHELNTPLGTIVGYAQLLNEGVSNEDKRLQYGQVIYREAKRCSRIIENLRTFAQRDVCQPESCEINGVISDVVETIYNCPGKSQDVRIETHLASNALVRGAEGQLDVVLVNVIMNAVQAAATVASDPLVTVVCSAQGDSVMVSITDNGPGIPQSQRNQVFDPFFTTKPDSSGLGLGLAISQSIVTAIGGTLTCDRDYEGGARFIMTLPLAFGRQV
jgi:PAS domain S-box-containing protein